MPTRQICPLTLLLLAGCAAVASKPANPQLVTFEAAILHPVLPAAEASKTQAVLRVHAKTPAGLERQPLHVAVVVDASGSMKGDPIEQMKAAAFDLVKKLEKRDRVTFVAFNTDAEVLARSELVEDLDLDELSRALEDVEAIGTTNLSAGLQIAYAELSKRPDTEEIRRLVVLSDGRPNTPQRVDALIAQLAGARIPVTALGFGLDYDELLLARAARKTGGHYEFVEAPEALAAVFDREVLRLKQIVARGAAVRITTGPGIAIERVEGQPPGRHAEVAYVPLGDLSAGETREIVLSLKTDSRRADVQIEVVDALLTFEDTIAGSGQLTRRQYVGATTSMDAERVEAGIDKTVRRSAARARAGSAALDAIALARAGKKNDAIKLLEAAIAVAEKDAIELDDDRVNEALENLRALVENLPELAARAELDSANVARNVRSSHWKAMSYTQ